MNLWTFDGRIIYDEKQSKTNVCGCMNLTCVFGLVWFEKLFGTLIMDEALRNVSQMIETVKWILYWHILVHWWRNSMWKLWMIYAQCIHNTHALPYYWPIQFFFYRWSRWLSYGELVKWKWTVIWCNFYIYHLTNDSYTAKDIWILVKKVKWWDNA